ncbi:MAG TPA: DUF2953 domain-containing protein [Chondromyces sp.]|nr:DUF2953 domain-containing protein [Chondromyces sp.]
MWYVWAVFGILLLIMLIIYFSTLHVHIYIFHGDKNDHINIRFKLWFGLIKYTLKIPLIKIKKDEETQATKVVFKKEAQQTDRPETAKESKDDITPDEFIDSLSDVKELVQHVVGMHTIVRKFLQKVSINQIKWNSMIGVKDAAVTGVLTGGLWAVKGSLISLLSHYMKLRRIPEVNITPSFILPITRTEFTCMLQFRIGHAIGAGIKVIRYWRGQGAVFKTKPLAYLTKDNKPSM